MQAAGIVGNEGGAYQLSGDVELMRHDQHHQGPGNCQVTDEGTLALRRRTKFRTTFTPQVRERCAMEVEFSSLRMYDSSMVPVVTY